MPVDQSLWDSRAQILMSSVGFLDTREVLPERLGPYHACPLTCPWLPRPEPEWPLGFLLACLVGSRDLEYEKNTLCASEGPPTFEVCSLE